MRIRYTLVLGVALIAPLAAVALAPVPASTDGASSTFSVQEKTQVPGRTLKAGTYSIRVVDHLNDRMIVRVDGPGKDGGTTFLALPTSTLTSVTARGPIVIKANGKTALRGFSFPDGTMAEFVYPKKEAVALAKSNNVSIPAIDPASEGMTKAQDLSAGDMQLVTLWMLSPTHVSPDQPEVSGIKAAKYQAPQTSDTASTQISRANAPILATPQQNSSSALLHAENVAPVPLPAVHVPKRKPVMAVLPHTAGTLAWVWLAGLFSFAGASLLTVRRSLASVVSR